MANARITTIRTYRLDQLKPGDFYKAWDGEGGSGGDEFGFIAANRVEMVGLDLSPTLFEPRLPGSDLYIRQHESGSVLVIQDRESKGAQLRPGCLILGSEQTKYAIINAPQHHDTDLLFLNLSSWEIEAVFPDAEQVFSRWQFYSGGRTIHQFGD